MEKELTFREALRALKGIHGKDWFLSVGDAISFYEEYETNILAWLQNHPLKTRRHDFLEKFPNAPLYVDGTPEVCCADIGYKENIDICGGKCYECWNKQIDDVEVNKYKQKDVEWVEEYPGSDNVICKGCGSIWNVLDNCVEEFVFCPKCGGKIVVREEKNDDNKL